MYFLIYNLGVRNYSKNDKQINITNFFNFILNVHSNAMRFGNYARGNKNL